MVKKKQVQDPKVFPDAKWRVVQYSDKFMHSIVLQSKYYGIHIAMDKQYNTTTTNDAIQ